MKGMSLIVRKITQIMAPIIFLYGIYIVVYGHLSPGGGFAGGVIMAGAYILQIIANGSTLKALKHEEDSSEMAEDFAILAFLIVGSIGLLIKGSIVFFKNFMWKGTLGELLSAGLIPLENIIVGAEVCAAMVAIFTAFLIYKDEVIK